MASEESVEESNPELTETDTEAAEQHTLQDWTSFIASMAEFYNSEALSDITLIVSKQRFHAHRFVLAKSSPVFKSMLYCKGWSDQKQHEIELQERSECEMVFAIFLKYMYTAEVQMSTDMAIGILCLADKYHVDSLRTLCVDFMIKHSKSPQLSTALRWYPWALMLHLQDLAEECRQTISWNFFSLLTSPEWTSMDFDFMNDFLRRSDLIVPNEFSLWEAVSEWLTSDHRDQELEKLATALLPLIRFPQMQVAQLHETEKHSLAQLEAVKTLLDKLISSAYRFRALCPNQQSLDVSFAEEFFQPRDYSELTADLVRVQNTMRFGIQIDVKVVKGPVPQVVKEGEWKIVYRKHGENWSLQIYPCESALQNGEVQVKVSVIVYDTSDLVLTVHKEDVHKLSRGQCISSAMTIPHMENAKHMGVLIKPVSS